jgi:hypothetical protein
MYMLNRCADGVSECHRCGGEVRHTICECVDEIGMPFWRTIRRSAACSRCHWLVKTPVDPMIRNRHPRTPGLVWRMVISWALIALSVAGIAAFVVHLDHLRRDHAEHPVAGDRWTIATGSWPDVTFANGARYAVVIVNAVDARQVTVARCNATADQKGDVEKACKTFPVAMDPISRGRVLELLSDGAIARISRASDCFAFWWGLAGAWVALVAGHCLLSRRYLRSRV